MLQALPMKIAMDFSQRLDPGHVQQAETLLLADLEEPVRLFVVVQEIIAAPEATPEMTPEAEVTAEVTAAKALTDEQTAALSATLKESVGQNVVIKTRIDESLIGGLVVKVGSRMIDTSIRAKLNKLQNAMKEVG